MLKILYHNLNWNTALSRKSITNFDSFKKIFLLGIWVPQECETKTPFDWYPYIYLYYEREHRKESCLPRFERFPLFTSAHSPTQIHTHTHKQTNCKHKHTHTNKQTQQTCTVPAFFVYLNMLKKLTMRMLNSISFFFGGFSLLTSTPRTLLVMDH